MYFADSLRNHFARKSGTYVKTLLHIGSEDYSLFKACSLGER